MKGEDVLTVYLDIIWLLNFLFDTLLLYLTGLILGRSIKKRRIIIGGFIGSLIILFSITELRHFVSHPFIKFLVSLIMVYAAYGFKRLRFFMTNLMVFYLCTFFIGGALIGAHYFLQFNLDLSSSLYLSNVYGLGDPISWLFVMIGFPIAWHFSRKTFDRWEMATIQYDQLVQVSFSIENNQIQLKGLIDSGNQLYDPISKKPVMIVSLSKVSHLLPESLVHIFEDPEKIWNGSQIPDEWINKISIVPYKVVGQNHKLLPCLKVKEVTIEKEGLKSVVPSILVAFVNQKLSEDDTFDCIIHPKMVSRHPTAKVS